MNTHRPYIPLGCTEQGRVTPTRLTKAHLDRRIAKKQETRGLPELLLSSGAAEGPYRRTRRSLVAWLRMVLGARP
jgi:hypothetical protein